MRNNVLSYKGYNTVIEYSAEDRVLHGKIEQIDDLVDFSSESAAEIEQAFHEAVDGYLAFCAEVGKKPDRVYSGSFNIRIKPAQHREMAALARAHGVSLNSETEMAITEHLRMARAT